MTEEERQHVEALMAEMDAWKPGDPMPEHSIREHLDAAKLATNEVGHDVQRFWLLTGLWILAWAGLISLVVYGALRLF